jgi:hypothetical protein
MSPYAHPEHEDEEQDQDRVHQVYFASKMSEPI